MPHDADGPTCIGIMNQLRKPVVNDAVTIETQIARSITAMSGFNSGFEDMYRRISALEASHASVSGQPMSATERYP